MRIVKLGVMAFAFLATGVIAWSLTSLLFRLENPNSMLSAVVSERDFRLQRGVSYGTHPRHRFDVYEPARGSGRAVVVFLYGGSWKSGKRSTYGFVGAALASRGYTVVIPDYRLFPEVTFPAFMDDAAQAYLHVDREIANGRQIFLMGHSAGAHMAALLALDPGYLDQQTRRPAGLVGLAGPYAFDPTTWPTTKDVFATAVSADKARPVAHVSPQAPPMLLMHGLKDDVVKLYNLRDMDAALKSADVSSQAIELEGTSHIGIMLAIARPFRWRSSVYDQVLGFLEAQTNGR